VSANLPLETTPAELKERIDAGKPLFLIDVREPAELQLARITGAEPIPMSSIPAALQHLEAKSDEGTLIIVCHHGVRSLQVANWLREHGVVECQSLKGGIDQWSIAVDPSIPRY